MMRCHAFAIAFLGLLLAATAQTQEDLPSAVGFVESQSLPIRVYYNTADNEPLATVVLTSVEQAWRDQVETMGFAPPITVDDDMQPQIGTRFYLVSTQEIRPSCVADLPDTPRTDCASVGRVWDGLPASYMPIQMSHLFSHNLQMTLDCVESPFAFEQTTGAIVSILFPGPDGDIPLTIAQFQAEPHLALYQQSGQYHYGASVFSFFLDQKYGSGDGRLLPKFWEATTNSGSIDYSTNWPTSLTPNEPDLLDAMTAVLGEQGVSFTDAFVEFSIARYFLGNNNDGQHIQGADAWAGAEPALEEHYYFDQLPLEDAEVTRRPQPLGVSYIVFETTGATRDQRLELQVKVSADMEWQAWALAVSGQGAQELPVPIEDNQGQLTVGGLDAVERVVLLVINLGDENNDSDVLELTGSTFHYNAEVVACPEVSVDKIEPEQVVAGETTTVRIEGEGFAADAEPKVVVTGSDIEVVEVVRLSSSELDVILRIADGAEPGKRDITVQLECGAEGKAKGALTVAGMGCLCDSAQPTSSWLLLAGVLCALVGRRFLVSYRGRSKNGSIGRC